MQKIRATLIKFAGSLGILGQEELFRLIAEEEDIIDASLKLVNEQSEAATVLEAYAQAEEEELKDIMMEVVRDTRDMNKAQMDMLTGLKEKFINGLSEIREKLIELDGPMDEKNKADKNLEKAKKNVEKSEKKLESTKLKAMPDKISAAEQAVTDAKAELEAAEKALTEASSNLDKVSAEIRTFKKEKLKAAFTAYSDLSKAYHQKCVEILTEYGGAIQKIKPEAE